MTALTPPAVTVTSPWHALEVPAMGTTLRLVGGAAGRAASAVDADLAAAAALVDDLARRWSRFDPGSALERLNDDPRTTVPVDPLLGLAVAAALRARVATGGLVDPTLGRDISAAGYRATLAGLPRVAPAAVAAEAVARPARSARPRPDDAAARVAVTPDHRTVTRTPGARIDLGATAKGLAADLAARTLAHLDRWSVDLGGDVRVGGRRTDLPQRIDVAHPVDGAVIARLALTDGAVATSTIARRAWRTPEGGIAHHVLDPATGRPAWTGVLQATARARTARDAEALASAALLRGPRGGAALLRAAGGVLVLADGSWRTVGT